MLKFISELILILAVAARNWFRNPGPEPEPEPKPEPKPEPVPKPVPEFPSLPTPVPPQLDAPADRLADELLKLHNQQRNSPLALNDLVSQIANRQAAYLAENHVWNDLHGRPVGGSLAGDMRELAQLLPPGKTIRTYGENAAAGQKSPYSVTQAWIKSRGHYRNMINPAYREVGFGHAVSTKNVQYWVAIFIG